VLQPPQRTSAVLGQKRAHQLAGGAVSRLAEKSKAGLVGSALTSLLKGPGPKKELINGLRSNPGRYGTVWWSPPEPSSLGGGNSTAIVVGLRKISGRDGTDLKEMERVKIKNGPGVKQPWFGLRRGPPKSVPAQETMVEHVVRRLLPSRIGGYGKSGPQARA